MTLRFVALAALLALTGLTTTGCVDDGYRRPGLVVVEERPVVRRDYRDYRSYDRYDRRYDRRDYRRSYDRYGDRYYGGRPYY